ncbi:hypothetical protein IKF30_02810 [Candidatus Saccharibacteria bacterium]|nr:hypothetical protein [Candidatus Saccharibacteria bacterium]
MEYDAYNTYNYLIKRIDGVCDSMIVVSITMIISSIITAVGFIMWISNFSTSGFSSEAQRIAYNTGGYAGTIGGVITILLTIASIALLIYRVVLKKRIMLTYGVVLKNGIKIPPFHSTKITISTILFIVSLLPLAIFLFILTEPFISL